MPIRRPFLQLFRPPNLFTVPGDPLCGALLVTHGIWTWRIAPALVVSLASYCAGLVINDLADYQEDLRDRPSRPLPSGAVSRRTAIGLACFCIGVALAAAAIVGPMLCLLTALLIGEICWYNFLAKKNAAVAPIAMGLCRGLSVLAGAVAALEVGRQAGPLPVSAFDMHPAFPAAATVALYIAGISVLARHETQNARIPPLIGWLIGALIFLQAGFCYLAGGMGWMAALLLLALWPISRLVASRSTQAKPHMANKLLVVQVAALGWDLVKETAGFKQAEAFFPAVTCTAQASFRTASQPREHGMVANGTRLPDLRKIMLWEQSSALVQGERIWSRYRAAGRKVGMMFWQQSLGDDDLDLILSPAPIHKHSGGMIQDCYAKPEGLNERLLQYTKKPFNLMHYWGPLASQKSSAWITDATCGLLADREFAPDLLFSYLPHLDYDLQRHGPGSKQAAKSLDFTMACIDRMKQDAQTHGYEWLFYGDYAIEAVEGAVFPNRRLHETGLLKTREIKGMLYADLFATPAFAMVDHQIAHVYTRDARATAAAREALAGLTGIESILGRDAQEALGLNHPRSGDLLLVAQSGKWFAYPWWTERKQAPDFATHVDIHNKPGYDPCELFFGWPPPSVSMDTTKIHGSHGRPGDFVGWSTSLEFAAKPVTMLDVARFTKAWLDSQP